MKKKLYFLLILIFSIPLSSYPCRCQDVSIADAVKSSDIIIKGKILSIIKSMDYEEQGLKIDTTGLDAYVIKYKSFAPLFLYQ